MTIKEQAVQMKLDSTKLAAQPLEARNKALQMVADALLEQKDKIIEANQADLDKAERDGLTAPILKRLKFNETKLQDVVKGIRELIELPDPLGKVQMKRELDSDMVLVRESCPIGVIGVIFESRPDAMVQISTLCLKSGNCAILKGGSEAAKTNKVLFEIIHQAAVAAGMPESCMMQAEAREEISELLNCNESVDY